MERCDQSVEVSVFFCIVLLMPARPVVPAEPWILMKLFQDSGEEGRGLVQDLKICIGPTKIKPIKRALGESKAQREGFCAGAAEPPPDPARMNSGALSTFGF